MVFHNTWLLSLIALCLCYGKLSIAMTTVEKQAMRDKVKEMFLHAYVNYKNNAFPADELMPLSCSGRYRNTENSRGDVDDALGNFSLTMIDSLDSLFLFNELDEFEVAVRSVITGVAFDSDLDVSVFETNIRVLGGLLGGHVAASAIRKANTSRMSWYSDQLLSMAVDIGNRLLPAFRTSTGIPLPRVNLRHGVTKLQRQEEHTCTACGGTMILEFAALSRLSGNPIYESVATRALATLWKQRSRHSDLVGRVINVHSGDWVRRESGVGAGFDSYYEYLLKAYVLLGESVYLHRFHTHYHAINRFISGPRSAVFPFLFLDVNMHRPSERARTFMDALFAFWPGLQVLAGDVKPAIALHEFLFQVHKQNKMLPEAFTPDLKAIWGEHLLRPELIESTYLLHRATGDPYYLDVGAQIVADLERYSRVPCGFAAIEDVRTMKQLDRLDSFVLAETFKYLYLLFADSSDLPISLSEYIFTTEAHLLPLSLSQIRHPESPVFSGLGLDPSSVKNSSHSTTASVQALHRNQHGDRDQVAEAIIHSRINCPAIHAADQYNACDSRPNSDSAPPPPTSSSSVCNRLDDPRFTPVMRAWLGHNATPSSGPYKVCSRQLLTKHMWRKIELIRQPLRHLAAATSDYNYDQQSDTMAGSVMLRAANFQPDNPEHLQLLKRMGIVLSVDAGGQLVLRHDQNMAENAQMAIAGLLFVHELVNLSKAKTPEETHFEARHVVIMNPPFFGREFVKACPAQFGTFPSADRSSSHTRPGPPTSKSVSGTASASWKPVVAPVRVAFPLDGCSPISDTAQAYPSIGLDWDADNTANDHLSDPTVSFSDGPLKGSIGLVRRGGCLFVEKARNLMRAGAVGGIVADRDPRSSITNSPLFAMSGDNESTADDVTIPFVLLFGIERDQLLQRMRRTWLTSGTPTTIMLTKQYDLSAAFAASLEYWDGLSRPGDLNVPVFKPIAIDTFQLLFDLRMLPLALTNYSVLPSRSMGGLAISAAHHHSPGDKLSSPNSAVANYEQELAMLLFVADNELSTYFPTTALDNLTVQDRIHNWLVALQYSLTRTFVGSECHEFLLTLSELALRNAMKSTATTDSSEPFSLNVYWTMFARRCFDRVQKHARYVSLFSPGACRAHFIQLTLSFSLRPSIHQTPNV